MILASITQRGIGTKVWISLSLSATNFKVGPWTLPVVTNLYLPVECLIERVNARVRLIPYNQSISCRAKPAFARLISTVGWRFS